MTLREKLAELEHKQWASWATHLSRWIVLIEEFISLGETSSALIMIEKKLKQWKEFQVPYSELSESVKDSDRIWADKVLNLLDNHLKNDELYKADIDADKGDW